MAQVKKSMRHRSAIKAHRQSVKRNLRNRNTKKGIRVALRAVTDAAAAKDTGKLAELMAKASSELDKAARTGAIHWKAAARKKSRLAHRTAQAAAAK
jgi:small subunit ribosomal protein S20